MDDVSIVDWFCLILLFMYCSVAIVIVIVDCIRILGCYV